MCSPDYTGLHRFLNFYLLLLIRRRRKRVKEVSPSRLFGELGIGKPPN
jgi:hypothetical protein